MKRMLHRGSAVLVAIAVVGPLHAAADPSAALAAAEDRYTRAITGRDIVALGKTLSEDLVYVHASGIAEGKRAYLKGTVDGGFRVVGARISDRQSNVFGNIGVTLGSIAYDVGMGENTARYMAVYRKEHGEWMLLRWQNAKPTSQVRGR